MSAANVGSFDRSIRIIIGIYLNCDGVCWPENGVGLDRPHPAFHRPCPLVPGLPAIWHQHLQKIINLVPKG